MGDRQTGRSNDELLDPSRRGLLRAAGGTLLASALGATPILFSAEAMTMETQKLRWGFVGTGMIANSMAGVLKMSPHAELAAVSSRKMTSAEFFANTHGAKRAFDSWQDMIEWDGVDAIYVATPTSVREEICVAAANAGKHVLGEKPFASLPSLERITEACRNSDVVFMDGTHFVHHPRTAAIQSAMAEQVGWPWSVDSAFQFSLPDRSNIRYNPQLEPLGAIGDAGWYNMRAAVEYLSSGISLESVDAHLRRDQQTGAAISGSGVLVFSDGSTSTWNCGFDSGAVIMDLRISGDRGSISVDNFLSQDGDGSASYLYRRGGWGPGAVKEVIKIESALPGAALMFEDFAAMVADAESRERSMRTSENTQRLLDAVWNEALRNETR
jgi:predicted dehydrogenase